MEIIDRVEYMELKEVIEVSNSLGFKKRISYLRNEIKEKIKSDIELNESVLIKSEEDIFIKKSYIDKQVALLENSLNTKELKAMGFTTKGIQKLEQYKITFFSSLYKYVSKETINEIKSKKNELILLENDGYIEAKEAINLIREVYAMPKASELRWRIIETYETIEEFKNNIKIISSTKVYIKKNYVESQINLFKTSISRVELRKLGNTEYFLSKVDFYYIYLIIGKKILYINKLENNELIKSENAKKVIPKEIAENYLTITETINKINSETDRNFKYSSYLKKIEKLFKVKKFITDGYIIKFNKKTYISKEFIDSQILLYNSSIYYTEVEKLKIKFYRNKFKGIFYTIYLFEFTPNFLAKDDFEIIKKVKDVALNIRGEFDKLKYPENQLTNTEKYISRDDVIRKINNEIFKGENLCGKDIPQTFKELTSQSYFKAYSKTNEINRFKNRAEFFDINSINIFFEKAEDFLFENNRIIIRNMTKEEYQKIDNTRFKKDFYTLTEFKDKLDENKIDYAMTILKIGVTNIKKLQKISEISQIKTIHFRVGESYSFFSKKEVDKCIESCKNYVTSEALEKKYNIKISQTISKKYNEKDLTKRILLNDSKSYFHKKYVEEIVNQILLDTELEKYDTLIEKYECRVRHYERVNGVNPKLKKTLGYLHNYVINRHNIQIKNKTRENSQNTIYFGVYMIIREYLSKELEYMTDDELMKFELDIFENTQIIINGEIIQKGDIPETNFKQLKAFSKYLNSFKIITYEFEPPLEKDRNSYQKYSEIEYAKLITVLGIITTNEYELKKMYRDWGKSSSVLYVLMHLCLAWRQSDLVSKLPPPNVALFKDKLELEETDGESIIKWFEEGNEVSDSVAKEICDDIEKMVEILRRKVGKNRKDLFCILPNDLHRSIATMMLINYANRDIYLKTAPLRYRQLVKSELLIMQRYTGKNSITKVFKDNFRYDLEKELDGGFLSTRAVKSFETLIADKSEELGLACGYAIASILRSHTVKKDVFNSVEYTTTLSNVTKIYVQQDIKVASKIACELGTVAFVKHLALGLIDKDYETRKRSEQVEMIKNFGLIPSELEEMYKIVDKKTEILERQFNRVIKGEKEFNEYLKLLLFANGNEVYDCSRNCKCSYKILKKVEDMDKSKFISEEVETCFYKKVTGTDNKLGCPYTVPNKFFIYQFKEYYDELIYKWENSTLQLTNVMCQSIFKNVYRPFIVQMIQAWGKEFVLKEINLSKVNTLIDRMEEIQKDEGKPKWLTATSNEKMVGENIDE